jgi:hypothetical protein
MNITHRPPSAEALTVLSALQSAVTKTLDKKQRLGHYAVVWKNGEVTEKHFNESKSNDDFQKFLLDSPEISDEEFQNIQNKREYLNA